MAAPPAGLLMCDPAASSHERPERVFTTPVVMPKISDGRDRVVYWVEHDTLDREENHYLVRYYDDGSKRACELRDELDLGVPTVSDRVPAEDREGVTGSPVVFGSPRSVLTLGYEGPLTTWSVGPSGWPTAGSGGVVDLSPWPDAFTRNNRGGDTSVLVDPPTQTIIWGNKCTSERVSNGDPCNVGEWGRVNITDLLAPVPPSGPNSVALESWVSMAPVALSHDAGGSSSDLLFAIGSEISVTAYDDGTGLRHREPTCDGEIVPLNHDYDCALATFFWDGSELAMADHWDAEVEFGNDPAVWNSSCCIIPPPEPPPGLPAAAPTLANGWVGEPVPILDGTVVYAAKAHGEIYRFNVDPVNGTLTLHNKVRFAPAGDDDSNPMLAPRYRIPPEQSPVIGRYPMDPSNFELLLMVNDSVQNQSKYLIMDVDDWTVGSSMADPVAWLELQTEHRIAGWAPGAAVRSINEQGPVYDALTFVIAVGADVDTSLPAVSTDCPASVTEGVPPRLYFVTRAGSWDPAWSVVHVDLVEDDTSTGRRCFELNTVPVLDAAGNPVVDPLTGLEQFDVVYDPIDVTAGVVVQGSMVYVATSDGRFWEYDTSDPSAVIHLAGYSGPWPRFRRNNNGLAQP